MKYKVKPGDTLDRIAKLSGTTPTQLIEANPQLKHVIGKGRLAVGTIVNIPDELSTAVTQPLPLSTASRSGPAVGAVGTALATELGTLSAKYETGGRGPGTVSTGSGDPGGVSYGSYQMASKTGTVARFVAQPDFQWATEFKNLKPGTEAFTAQWKKIATTDPVAFQLAQHSFIKKTHYDLLVEKTREEDQLDINSRSRALQDVVWSTSVQHGGATPIVHNAIKASEVSQDSASFDGVLIKAIYAERGRKRADGKLAWFSKSSPAVQAGVAKRFKNELIDALNMLAQEQT